MKIRTLTAVCIWLVSHSGVGPAALAGTTVRATAGDRPCLKEAMRVFESEVRSSSMEDATRTFRAETRERERYHGFNGGRPTWEGRVYALDREGQKAGWIDFTLTDGWLEINRMEVTAKDLRTRGLGKLMFGQLLKDHPEIRVIETVLIQDNEVALKAALARGLGLREAVMETPAYKIRKAYGFSKLRSFSRDGFVVER